MKDLLIIVFLLISLNIFSQKHNQPWLIDFANVKSVEYQKKRIEAEDFASKNDIPIKQILPNGRIMELQEIRDGVPQYYITNNAGASQTSRANTLYLGGGLGLSVTGNGYDKVGEWDEAKVRTTHQEFGSRVTLGDSPSTTSNHATHVAGTIIAAGVVSNAKGMAYEAEITTYDWNSDESEMATAASNGMEISNHSYGFGRGWVWTGSSWTWYGNTSISSVEDYLFGFYDIMSKDWDDLAYNAPYYLICKAAGNDRGDGTGSTPSTAEIDGGADGYDCIGTIGVAKNILTVGAVNEVASYTNSSDVVMSSFSGWGPADDGRIKPDIVAKGVSVYSSVGYGDASYSSYSGTSMATPSAVGTMVLLQQHYQNTHGSTPMKASTLKALVINTADEAGPNIGPDYMFGWGLINAEKAALLINEDAGGINVIDEQLLSNGDTYTRNITVGSGEPLKVTIVWTDPSGSPTSAQLNPSTSMLVNDLDLRLSDGSTTYYAWKLDRSNPSSAATNTGENNVDNVETVYVASPVAGTYTITVDHDGALASSQAFSIIISGDIDNIIPPVADFDANNISPQVGSTVYFSDLSSQSPISWTWSFLPSTVTYLNGTSSVSQNPEVSFDIAGAYSVELTATNAFGSDTELKTDYINTYICNLPTTQASNCVTSNLSANSMVINWTRGSGAHVLVVVREINPVNPAPTDGTTYTANSVFGLGSEIGDGNFVVYSGDGSEVSVSGLNNGKNYYIAVYEYSVTNCFLLPASVGNGKTQSVACNYCASTYTNTSDDWFSNVTLNNINNNSGQGGSDSYEDFTAQQTNLKIGNSYPISATIDMNGNWEQHVWVWIDWNQDCDFDDVGESFDLGDVVNTGSVSSNIVVPLSALLGVTTMRIVEQYSSDPSSCDLHPTIYGETEDYSVNIVVGDMEWLGNTSEWNNTANWSYGKVPNSIYNVTIPAGVTSPIISSGTNAICFSLTLEEGASITIEGNLEIEN